MALYYNGILVILHKICVSLPPSHSLAKDKVGVIRLGEVILCLLPCALFAPIRSPDATLRHGRLIGRGVGLSSTALLGRIGIIWLGGDLLGSSGDTSLRSETTLPLRLLGFPTSLRLGNRSDGRR